MAVQDSAFACRLGKNIWPFHTSGSSQKEITQKSNPAQRSTLSYYYMIPVIIIYIYICSMNAHILHRHTFEYFWYDPYAHFGKNTFHHLPYMPRSVQASRPVFSAMVSGAGELPEVLNGYVCIIIFGRVTFMQLVWYLMIFAWSCWNTNSVNIHLPNPFQPKLSKKIPSGLLSSWSILRFCLGSIWLVFHSVYSWSIWSHQRQLIFGFWKSRIWLATGVLPRDIHMILRLAVEQSAIQTALNSIG